MTFGRPSDMLRCPPARGTGYGARRSVGDADAQAAEALALVLDLDDLDPADLAGRGDVRATVGLLVQAHDVDDPDLLDLGWDEVGRGADDVGDGERLVPGQDAHVDAPPSGHLGVAGGLDGIPEAQRHLGQVEVHPRGQRLHVSAGDRGTEVTEYHATEHVQAGVGAHQVGTPGVVQRAAHRGARWRQRVAFGRDQVEVIALAGADDVGLHPAPQQDPVVGGLALAARIVRRPVENDSLGIAGQHDRIPFAQRLVVQFQPVRPPLNLTHPGSLLPGRGGAGTAHCQGRTGTAYRQGRTGTAHRQGRTGTDYRQGRTGTAYRQGRTGTAYRQGRTGTAYRQGRTGTAYRQDRTGTADCRGKPDAAVTRGRTGRRNCSRP